MRHACRQGVVRGLSPRHEGNAMPTRSARRRAAHARAVATPVRHREAEAAECAGNAAVAADVPPPSSVPPPPSAPPLKAPSSVARDRALHDRLWADADSLLAICRRHAALVLAGIEDERASRLDACRVIWTNYAA